jgi:hypothetical protein
MAWSSPPREFKIGSLGILNERYRLITTVSRSSVIAIREEMETGWKSPISCCRFLRLASALDER